MTGTEEGMDGGCNERRGVEKSGEVSPSPAGELVYFGK